MCPLYGVEDMALGWRYGHFMVWMVWGMGVTDKRRYGWVAGDIEDCLCKESLIIDSTP